MPDFIPPQLATLAHKVPNGNNWLHEIKWDGYRFIAVLKNKKIVLYTRHKNDWTHFFTRISQNLEKIKCKTAIFDGEIVALNRKKKSDFQLLQNKLKNNDKVVTIYYIFDLLYFNGKDIRHWPLIERKKLLKKILKSSNKEFIRYCDHVIGHGQHIFNTACRLNLEGIISKDTSSAYISKRTHSWLKIKCINRQEFLVCGYTKPQRSRQYFGALVLGIYENKKLCYCGLVGTGFTEQSLKEIAMQLKKYEIKESPFEEEISIRNVTWVKPYLIAEIEFTEWTKDHALRHPSFKGIRLDKLPNEVINENIPYKNRDSIMTNQKKIDLIYPLTHSQKLLYPKVGITKLELAEFYQTIQEWIIPHLKKRPLTLVRCPDGQEKVCFYQKHLQEKIKEIHPIMISEKNGKGQYSYINDIAGLIALVQMCVLEIHIWNCHVDKVKKPDLIIFDLDPAPNVAWKKVIQCAFHIKDQLEKLELQSFLKTTGGKGLHIVIPIARRYTWQQINLFASSFVKTLTDENPNEYIATMSKQKRYGKIFIDYFRNNFGATSIAPYSSRANKDATVSVPIFWHELTTKFTSNFYTVKNVTKRLARLTNDPWDGFFELKQSLKLMED